MQHWYLIYTKPKCEELVASKLINKGFEVLHAKIRERKPVRGKFRYRLSTLFPCYIFVRFDRCKSYNFIHYTRGIRTIVGTENVPTVVSGEIIEMIRERMIDGAVDLKSLDFEYNEKVYIEDGLFADLDAIFEKQLNGTERAMVLIKAINAHVVVESALLKRVNE